MKLGHVIMVVSRLETIYLKFLQTEILEIWRPKKLGLRAVLSLIDE
jgi:hypothetical protein